MLAANGGRRGFQGKTDRSAYVALSLRERIAEPRESQIPLPRSGKHAPKRQDNERFWPRLFPRDTAPRERCPLGIRPQSLFSEMNSEIESLPGDAKTCGN